MLSLVKRLFPLSLRPCWGNAEEPEQKPPLYGQGRDLLTDCRLCYPNILTGFPQALKESSFISPFLILHKVKPPKETVLPHPASYPPGSDKRDCEPALTHLRPALAFCVSVPAAAAQAVAQPAQICIRPGKRSLC